MLVVACADKWVGRKNGMGIDGAAMLDFYVNEVKQLQANGPA